MKLVEFPSFSANTSKFGSTISDAYKRVVVYGREGGVKVVWVVTASSRIIWLSYGPEK